VVSSFRSHGNLRNSRLPRSSAWTDYDSLAALGFANLVEPRRLVLGLLARAAADAERGSGSCRRFCGCNCCRRHAGCIKAVKAAGKVKSSKKVKLRMMTRLRGVSVRGDWLKSVREQQVT